MLLDQSMYAHVSYYKKLTLSTVQHPPARGISTLTKTLDFVSTTLRGTMNYPDHNGTHVGSNDFFDLIIASTPKQARPYIFFTITCLLFASLAQHVEALIKLARRKSRLPRGPWGFPLIGSYLSIGFYPERTLNRWASKYGAFYSVTLGKQLFVVLSSPDVVKDLVITNGNVFSGRQTNVRNHEVFAERGITASQYHEEKWYLLHNPFHWNDI